MHLQQYDKLTSEYYRDLWFIVPQKRWIRYSV